MSPKMPNSRRNLDLAIERAFGDRETSLRMRRVLANVIVGQLIPDGVVKGGSAAVSSGSSTATSGMRAGSFMEAL